MYLVCEKKKKKISSRGDDVITIAPYPVQRLWTRESSEVNKSRYVVVRHLKQRFNGNFSIVFFGFGAFCVSAN